jgi:hypothetical protein
MQPSLLADISALCLSVAHYSPILAILFFVRSVIARRTDKRLFNRIEKLKDELEAVRSWSRYD